MTKQDDDDGREKLGQEQQTGEMLQSLRCTMQLLWNEPTNARKRTIKTLESVQFYLFVVPLRVLFGR